MRVFLYLVFCLAATAATITEKTAGMKKLNGFYPLYWDEKAGNLFLEIERAGEKFLFYTSLAAGLGSNDVGLERNQIGQERLMRFERPERRARSGVEGGAEPPPPSIPINTRRSLPTQNSEEAFLGSWAFAFSRAWILA